MPDTKILEDVERRFDDYFFEATRGRNDVRRKEITAAIHQAERILIMSVKEKIHTIFNYPCDCNRKMNVCECDFRDIVKILSILSAEPDKKD